MCEGGDVDGSGNIRRRHPLVKRGRIWCLETLLVKKQRAKSKETVSSPGLIPGNTPQVQKCLPLCRFTPICIHVARINYLCLSENVRPQWTWLLIRACSLHSWALRPGKRSPVPEQRPRKQKPPTHHGAPVLVSRRLGQSLLCVGSSPAPNRSQRLPSACLSLAASHVRSAGC